MELGSEFDLSCEKITKKENNLYQYLESYMVQWYDSARSAIRTIAYDSRKTVLLPEYICESVIRCYEKSRIIFYHIDDKFDIDEQDLFSKLNDSVGVVYICHYYGFLQDVNLLKEIYHKVTRVGAIMIDDIHKINKELEAYNPELLKRPQVIAANKMDACFSGGDSLRGEDRSVGRRELFETGKK